MLQHRPYPHRRVFGRVRPCFYLPRTDGGRKIPQFSECRLDGCRIDHDLRTYGSSYSPDIAIVIPVFHKGQLVAFSANTAHHLDIGGSSSTSRTSTPRACCSRAPSSTRRAGRNEALWEDGGAGGGISTNLTLGSAQKRSNWTSWLIFDDRPERREVRQRDGAGLAGCFTCTPRQTGISSAPCINALAHS